MGRHWLRTGLLLLPLGFGELAAQALDVAWHGEAPQQGTLAYLVVRGTGLAVAVDGDLGRTALRFEPVGNGAFVALAGVPIDAADTVHPTIRVRYADGRVVRATPRLPVVGVRFPSERLSVAPEFSRPPDSALAVRIARENRLARRVSERALTTPRLWRGAFVPPRDAAVTSPYGTGRVFNGAVRSRHLGTDFQGLLGDSVQATNRGVVALVGDFYYAGRIVYLNHGAGLVTAYLHLSETLVQTGDTVEVGQLIGRVGRSGRVTGPHLHWAVKHGPYALDGRSLLALPPIETIGADR
ncbi:MAG: M23 family metallopeptidase [Gemmatimonadota bacterium]|nr:M23 family metallopeptidase [Gemmatimonadota bacterium]